MNKDKIIRFLSRQAEKWMNANQCREINGTPKTGNSGKHKIDFYPRQILYSYIDKTETNFMANSGGLISDPKHSTKKEFKLRTEARIGDLDNSVGHGVGHKCQESDMPLKSMKAFERECDELTDSVLKLALKEYFDYHSSFCEYDEDKFQKFSEEEPVIFSEKEKELKFGKKEIIEALEETSDALYKIKKVESAQVTATVQKVNRGLVNLERTLDGKKNKSQIFTSNVAAYVHYFVGMRDKNKQIIQYSERLADFDLEKVLNKKAIWNKCNSFIKDLMKRINCEVQDSGLYPAIFDGSATGILIHEGLAAHLLSAREIMEYHATTFKEKVDQRVLPSFISVYNDPSKKGMWGSYNFDEEGIKSQRITLIENGVLKDFLHDRSTAGRMGRKSNGCCRTKMAEEDAKDLSTLEDVITEPRIGIIEVKSSKPEKFESLVERLKGICAKTGVEYGLLVEGGGGDVSPETGEFRIYPHKISRIYRNGKIVPVSSASILGNPYNMLNDIQALGDQNVIAKGFCGSESGWVYTSGIAPYALLSKVEVRRIEEDVLKKRLIPSEE
ncbi:hypothetical protein COS75_00225 [Candidatus Pacearchaeota archaeon CG06_land_8_20_14_3_00_35_12]|nr:MAG: hypothetical protein COS75_00225 [Candidatus Pacearchaeota archaeon CG06_land_8_20_14_3_00_35_12]